MAYDWSDVVSAEKREDRRTVREFPCGASVHRQNRSLIVTPPSGGWRALSTGSFNGGFMSSPSAVFNTTSIGGRAEYASMGRPKEFHDMRTREYARFLGLDPDSTVGLGTAAHMDNAATGTAEADGIEVSAVITGGIRGNGGRAGDPAGFDEMERNLSQSGTIVIILIIDADLPDSALLGAVMTATEAKSRTLLRLMGKSLYSKGFATGSGTDQVAVLCNKGGGRAVEGYCNGSPLAGAIRECVEGTLAKALDNQTMMNPEAECNPYLMASRHKITEADCHNEIRYPFRMKALKEGRNRLSRDARAAATVSAVLHIMDEAEWGMISPETAAEACKGVLLSVMMGAPSLKDPVLRRRFEMADTPAEILSLSMAMMLFDRATEIDAEGSP